MKKKSVSHRLGLCAIAGCVALTACGGAKKSAAPPPKPQNVSGTVVVAEPGDNPGDISLRNKLAAAFMKLHPNVHVKILIVPATNYPQKVQTMIAGGKAPDVFTSGDVQIPNIVSKKLALDLTPLVKRDKYDLSDFSPQIIKGLTYDGQLSGLTDNWDTQVMYYNDTLFREAGISPPTQAWSWQDFTSAAQKLTSGSGPSKIYGSVFDNWFAPYFDQIWSNGGDPYPNNGKSCGYDSPQSVNAFNSIVDLYKTGVSPTPSQFSGQGAEQLFLSGKVGMMLGSGRWAAYDLRDVSKFDWKIAPIPAGPSGRANFFHLSMFAVARASKNTEASWEFLKYMVSPEGINLGLSAMQGIPARMSIANSAAFKNDPFSVKHNAVTPFLQSLPTVHVAPNLPNFSQVQDAVTAQLAPMWSLNSPPARVLPSVCQHVGPLLSVGAAPGGG
jgi:multiple sugar transport system substrate-binding protein